MKSLKQIILEDISPEAKSSMGILLFFDRLQSNPKFQEMLSAIKLPTEKYQAISKFATLIGIPEPKLIDFLTNVKPKIEKGTEQQ